MQIQNEKEKEPIQDILQADPDNPEDFIIDMTEFDGENEAVPDLTEFAEEINEEELTPDNVANAAQMTKTKMEKTSSSTQNVIKHAVNSIQQLADKGDIDPRIAAGVTMSENELLQKEKQVATESKNRIDSLYQAVAQDDEIDKDESIGAKKKESVGFKASEERWFEEGNLLEPEELEKLHLSREEIRTNEATRKGIEGLKSIENLEQVFIKKINDSKDSIFNLIIKTEEINKIYKNLGWVAKIKAKLQLRSIKKEIIKKEKGIKMLEKELLSAKKDFEKAKDSGNISGFSAGGSFVRMPKKKLSPNNDQTELRNSDKKIVKQQTEKVKEEGHVSKEINIQILKSLLKKVQGIIAQAPDKDKSSYSRSYSKALVKEINKKIEEGGITRGDLDFLKESIGHLENQAIIWQKTTPPPIREDMLSGYKTRKKSTPPPIREDMLSSAKQEKPHTPQEKIEMFLQQVQNLKKLAEKDAPHDYELREDIRSLETNLNMRKNRSSSESTNDMEKNMVNDAIKETPERIKTIMERLSQQPTYKMPKVDTKRNNVGTADTVLANTQLNRTSSQPGVEIPSSNYANTPAKSTSDEDLEMWGQPDDDEPIQPTIN